VKRWIKWTLMAVILSLLAAGALRALSARKTQRDALAAQAARPAQAAVELMASDVVQVRMVELPHTLALSGALKAVNSATVKARVPGELQGLVLREGDFVKAGDIVARIDATEYLARAKQAQQQAESARAQVDIAKRSFDNNRSLVDKGFISKTALDASLSSLSAAEANHRAALAGVDVAQKSLDDTALRAPISGHIAQRLAQPGERVGVDARIVEIVDGSRLELEASLNAADSVHVRTGQTATVTVEGATQPVAAHVVRINPNAVAGSRAVLVYLALESGAGLRQGLFAQGSLQTRVSRTLAVPLSAVRTDKPEPYVQLMDKGQVVHQSVAQGVRGDLDGQTLVAVQGLTEGTSVLVGSVGKLRAGTPVKHASGSQ
jgi:RND family efflux transporter MFP subunit